MEWLLEKKIGKGNFSHVFLARHKTDDRVCAVKRLKGTFKSLRNVASLREVQMLRDAGKHCNIVELHQVIFDSTEKRAYFVFEYMANGSLSEWLHHKNMAGGACTREEVQNVAKCILSGLHHVHSHGLFHRDIKPENILRSGSAWKVADFTLARHQPQVGSNFHDSPEETAVLTDYVSTRWYRSPELLLNCVGYTCTYSSKVDIWAVGCVLVEMITLEPFHPGETDVDQIVGILEKLGTSERFQCVLKELGITVATTTQHIDWESLAPGVDNNTHNLLRYLLAIEPAMRFSCQEALQHQFFSEQTKGTVATDGHSRPPVVTVRQNRRGSNHHLHPPPRRLASHLPQVSPPQEQLPPKNTSKRPIKNPYAASSKRYKTSD